MREQTICDYLHLQTADFSTQPFSTADSLVLSTLAYLYFEQNPLVAAAKSAKDTRIPLPMALCGCRHRALIGKDWLNCKDGYNFLIAVLESARFMGLSLSNYESEFSDIAAKQFAAVSFHFPDGGVYVAYRGTDSSITGWREDLNLSYSINLPSQVSARSYLEYIAASEPAYIYLGGHSKGGNLAEFAAATCNDEAFSLIRKIYSHDGPAFISSPSQRFDSPEYLEKLDKSAPESSVIGMLLENRGCCRLLQARSVLLLQHASTNWLLDGSEFIPAEKHSASAQVLSSTLNSWAVKFDPEKRKVLIDTVFDSLLATGAVNFAELIEDPVKNTRIIIENLQSYPEDVRNEVGSMFIKVFDLLKDETIRKVKHSISQARPPRLAELPNPFRRPDNRRPGE